jgi:hypothetical protein
MNRIYAGLGYVFGTMFTIAGGLVYFSNHELGLLDAIYGGILLVLARLERSRSPD